MVVKQSSRSSYDVRIKDVELLIDWGWSHPHGQADFNPYGALLNAMRVREKYGIQNSNYSFDERGQVQISLKLFTKGAANAVFDLVSSSLCAVGVYDV